MCSVSVNGVPRREWTEQMVAIADRVALRVLEGVGIQASDSIEDGSITRVVRRQCTDQERRGVLEKYLKAA